MAGLSAYALKGDRQSQGGPNITETNGPGNPLSAGDQIFRDRAYTR